MTLSTTTPPSPLPSLLVPLPGLETLSLPPSLRFMTLSEVDYPLLSLLPWRLLTTMSHHRLSSLVPSPSHVAIRASVGGYVFYPHHLVRHNVESTDPHSTLAIALISSQRYGELYEILSLIRHSPTTFISRSRLDVRRENLLLPPPTKVVISPLSTPTTPQENTSALPSHRPIMPPPEDLFPSLVESDDSSLDLSKIFSSPTIKESHDKPT